MSLSDSRTGPACGYVFPQPVGGLPPPERVSQVPRLICPRALSLTTPGSPTNALTRCFFVGSRLQLLGQTGHFRSGVTRPTWVRLRYGSRVRRTRLRAADCSDNALVWLPVERVIHRVNSFQFTRSARLNLAHPRPPRKTRTGINRQGAERIRIQTIPILNPQPSILDPQC